jgi:hypothetical protein
MNTTRLGVAIAAAVLSSSALAGAPSFLDARAAAMGGVGVAAARPRAASFFNPALLSVRQPEKSNSFQMLTPSVRAFVDDRDELRETVDDFEDDFLIPFEDAIDAADANPNVATVNEVINRAQALSDELVRINNDQATLDVGLGISFALPGQSFGVGVFASGSARVNLSLQYRDDVLLNDIITTTTTANIPDYNEGDLQSSVRAIGAGTTQAGISLSTSVAVGGYDIALGVSPKMVDFRAYDLVADVDNFDEDDIEDNEVSEQKLNFDLGLATHLDETKNWLLGVSIQNLLSQEVRSDDSQIAASITDPGTYPAVPISGVALELQPTITVGVSYSTESLVLAADVQLNETDGFHTVEGQQMVGIGAEYDLLERLQFRLGARSNLADSGSDPVFSAGLGLDLWGATIEVAAMGNADAAGASVQIGAMF